MKITDEVLEWFIKLDEEYDIKIEGSALNYMDEESLSDTSKLYISKSKNEDSEKRRARLTIAQDIQKKNKELKKVNSINNRLLEESREATLDKQSQIEKILHEYDILAKRSKTRWSGFVIKYAIIMLMSILFSLLVIYVIQTVRGVENEAFENLFIITFSNMVGQCFGIIAIILGYNKNIDEKRSEI